MGEICLRKRVRVADLFVMDRYDDRVALDLLSRLRAWSKAEGPWKTGPSPGRLGARTDSCPTDFVRRTEVQEWIEELSDSGITQRF